MPQLKDVLERDTFKEEGMEVERRVYYTLTDKKGLETHRLAKTLAGLIAILRKKKILSEKELDELLLEVI